MRVRVIALVLALLTMTPVVRTAAAGRKAE